MDVVGVIQPVLTISELLISWGFHHSALSLGMVQKLENIISGHFLGGKYLIGSRWQVTATWVPTCYKWGSQKTIPARTTIEPSKRWTKAAEDHSRWNSCQLRTGSWGYNSHGPTKVGQGSESVLNMKQRGPIFPCVSRSCCRWGSNHVITFVATYVLLIATSISLWPQWSHILKAVSCKITSDVTKLLTQTGFLSVTLILPHSDEMLWSGTVG